MKRNALALGVAALLGMAGSAQAKIILGDATDFGYSADYMGHIIAPGLVNAANGNFTNFNVVNTDTKNGKVLKVRVRSAVNSDDLFDFQVFMSPGDMWSAVITTDPVTGLGSLITKDTSCTLPAFINNGELHNFKLNRLPKPEDIPNVKDWTREGYIEILNMADIPGPGSAAYKADTAFKTKVNQELYNGRLYKATKHSPDGKPSCDPAVMGAYNDYFSTYEAHLERGLDHPTGGLFANSTMMNGSQNLVFSTEVPAIEAWGETEGGWSPRANLIFSPQVDNKPVPNIDHWTSDPLFRTSMVSTATVNLPRNGNQVGGAFPLPILKVYANDVPDLSTPYVRNVGSVNAGSPLANAAKLANSIAHTAIYNEFYNNPEYGGQTDWSLINPVRRYQVAMDYEAVRKSQFYNQTGYDGRVFTMPYGVGGWGSPLYKADYKESGTWNTVDSAPWIQYYNPANTSLDKPYTGKRICVAADGAVQWNREEGMTKDGYVVSPSDDNRARFCGEVTVLGVGNTDQPTAVLGAEVAALGISSPFKEGWMAISTENYGTNTGVPGVGWSLARGLPIMGQAYMKAVNSMAAPGVTTNYGMSFLHRYENAQSGKSELVGQTMRKANAKNDPADSASGD